MADMRATRTRQYLREAVMALLLEKPYDDITVREVCEQARVSKNSFYNHYAALSDLVQDCYLQEIIYFRTPMKRLRDYACRHDACTETLNERAHLLEFFKANPNLARVILENVCISPYFDSCRHAEEDLLLDHLETEYASPPALGAPTKTSPATSYGACSATRASGSSPACASPLKPW